MSTILDTIVHYHNQIGINGMTEFKKQQHETESFLVIASARSSIIAIHLGLIICNVFALLYTE